MTAETVCSAVRLLPAMLCRQQILEILHHNSILGLSWTPTIALFANASHVDANAKSNSDATSAKLLHLPSNCKAEKTTNNNGDTGNENDNKKKGFDDDASQMIFVQTEEWHKNVKCHNCGKKGHLSPDCPKHFTMDKKDWFVKKAINAHQQGEGNEKSGSNGSSDDANNNSGSVRWNSPVSAQSFQT